MSQTFLRYLNVIIGIIFFYQFRPGQFEMLSNDIFKSSDYRKYENAWKLNGTEQNTYHLFLVLEYRKIGVCSVSP